MDALSRNTASVAQDFHKAGGVDLKDHHQFFNKTITSKQVALLHHQQKQKYRDHNRNFCSKQKSFSSSENSSDEDKYKSFDLLSDQRKAMSAFLSRNFGLQEKEQSNNNSSIKINVTPQNQRITQSLLKNQKQNTEQQQIKSPPAQPINLTNSNNHKQLKTQVKTKNNYIDNNCHKTLTTLNNNSAYKGHRLDLIRNKENSNSIFSSIEYQSLSKFGTQFQNYVKDIINKYYAETPLLFPVITSQQLHNNVLQSELSAPGKRQKQSETEEYIEYLKNKEDITLTIKPKINNNTNRMSNNAKTSRIQSNNSCDSLRPGFILKRLRTSFGEEEPKCQIIPLSQDRQTASDVDYSISESIPLQQHLVPIDMSSNSSPFDSRRNIRKQSQPKKIKTPPEIIMMHMRDKYLKKMVDRKKSCTICTHNSRKSMLVFPYHTPASLLLHRIWKHTERSQRCYLCSKQFSRVYSLKVHYRLIHNI